MESGIFVQRELKQKHSDSLCEREALHQGRHRASGCSSCPGRQWLAITFRYIKIQHHSES